MLPPSVDVMSHSVHKTVAAEDTRGTSWNCMVRMRKGEGGEGGKGEGRECAWPRHCLFFSLTRCCDGSCVCLCPAHWRSRVKILQSSLQCMVQGTHWAHSQIVCRRNGSEATYALDKLWPSIPSTCLYPFPFHLFLFLPPPPSQGHVILMLTGVVLAVIGLALILTHTGGTFTVVSV